MTFDEVAVADGKYRVRVWTEGAGPPLLFLHGFDGHPGDAPFVHELAAERLVVAPELPGYGESQGIEQIDDVLDMTLYHRQLLEELGYDSIDVIGHSLGGMFAAELAAICPQHVRRLVLAAPLGLWLDDSPIPDIFVMGPSQLLKATWHDPGGDAARAALSRVDGDASPEDAALTRTFNLATAGRFLWPIPDRGLRKRLPLIQAPTLVVMGGSDQIVGEAYGPSFASLIPDARVEVIPDAGHSLMLEEPDAFLKAVQGFLA